MKKFNLLFKKNLFFEKTISSIKPNKKGIGKLGIFSQLTPKRYLSNKNPKNKQEEKNEETPMDDGNYVGQKLNKKAHGFGEFTSKENIYKGHWQDGKMHGKGILFFLNKNESNKGEKKKKKKKLLN